MSLTLNQQFIESINKAKKILILTPSFPKINDLSIYDGLGAGLGLLGFLEKINKNVDLVIPNFTSNERLSFLPNLEKIKSNLTNIQKFTIKVNTQNTSLKRMDYYLKDGYLYIHLTPKNGIFRPEHIQTLNEEFNYDLIITVDLSELSLLGDIFEKNAKFFLNNPIINIDHKNENEHYGTLNLIDPLASSSSEILYEEIEKINRNFIDEKMATCFLTGIIAETKSFQKIKSPRVFRNSGKLIALGAPREKIIQALLQNYNLKNLKLWGAVLSNLKYDSEHKIAWSILTKRDFLETKGEEMYLSDLFHEFIAYIPELEKAFLLYETPLGKICGLFYNKHRGQQTAALASLGDLENYTNLTYLCFNTNNLEEAEKGALTILSQ